MPAYGGRYTKLVYQSVLRLVPHALMYAAVTATRRLQPPYHLVKSGDTVVQIGAAGQLCPLGRSQAIIYSRLVRETGRVLVFEAIPENISLFRTYADRHGIENVNTHCIGLWKEKGVVAFDAMEAGPCSARIKTARQDKRFRYSTERRLCVDTLDSLLAEQGVNRLDLINITVNGAEPEILEGGMETLARFRPALCMPENATNIQYFDESLAPFGYKKQLDGVRLHPLGKIFKILWAETPGEKCAARRSA